MVCRHGSDPHDGPCFDCYSEAETCEHGFDIQRPDNCNMCTIARLRAELEQTRAEALRHIDRLQEDLNVQCQARMRAENERDVMRALAERSVADALVRSRETVSRVTWVDHVTGECCESTEVMSADMTRAGNAIASAIRMLVIAKAEAERDAMRAERDEAFGLIDEITDRLIGDGQSTAALGVLVERARATLTVHGVKAPSRGALIDERDAAITRAEAAEARVLSNETIGRLRSALLYWLDPSRPERTYMSRDDAAALAELTAKYGSGS